MRCAQVCEGELTAQAVRAWLSLSYKGGLKIEASVCFGSKADGCRSRTWSHSSKRFCSHA